MSAFLALDFTKLTTDDLTAVLESSGYLDNGLLSCKFHSKNSRGDIIYKTTFRDHTGEVVEGNVFVSINGVNGKVQADF